MTDKWTEKWNALPYEIRHIGSMVESQMRINQLEMEKNRLKRAYQRSVREANAHIKNLRRWIETEGE